MRLLNLPVEILLGGSLPISRGVISAFGVSSSVSLLFSEVTSGSISKCRFSIGGQRFLLWRNSSHRGRLLGSKVVGALPVSTVQERYDFK